MRLRFLGTGASGGTPGSGHSQRMDSSLVVEDGTATLLDVTRHSSRQSEHLKPIGAILQQRADAVLVGLQRMRDGVQALVPRLAPRRVGARMRGRGDRGPPHALQPALVKDRPTFWRLSVRPLAAAPTRATEL